jgi:hypothetical protein
LFTDDLRLRDLTKQVAHLNIDMKKSTVGWSKTVSNIFALIISLCKNLTVLNFCYMFILRQCVTPVYHLRSENNISSTLMKLKVNVGCFADCLYLHDGRFECLSTLIVKATQIFDPVIDIGQRVSIISIIIFIQKSVWFL